MIRLSMVFWLAAIAVSAIFLYEIKHEVQDLEERLAEVHGEILRDQEAIQVLKAEWSYLNRPRRIAELADRYLDLKPLEASQIASFGEMPAAPEIQYTNDAQAVSAPAAPAADGIGNLIEAVTQDQPVTPAPRPTAAAAQPSPAPQSPAAQGPAAQSPVNPVTGTPLPVIQQPGAPVQLLRTGARQ